MQLALKPFFFLLAIYVTAIQAASAGKDTISHYRPAHIGFIYPLSTNGRQAGHCENGFSLHALIGVSATERAFALAGLGNNIHQKAKGVVISGLFNRIGSEATGVQLAGLTNLVQGQTKGLQLAGLYNRTGSVTGLQIAGLLNQSDAAADIQISGLINSSKKSKAIQLAGLINRAIQASGLQLAGLFNLADTATTQIAGLVNISKKSKGLQMAGLINIAAESDYPIAPINIIKNGTRRIGLSTDADGNTMLNFRSGGRRTYGLLGMGYNFSQSAAPFLLEMGLGLDFPVKKYFRLNLELSAAAITDFTKVVYNRTSLRLLGEVTVAKRIGLFAGPSLNYLGYPDNGEEIIKKRYIWKEQNGKHYNGLYWGLTAGIHISI